MEQVTQEAVGTAPAPAEPKGLEAAHQAADAMVEQMFPDGELQASDPKPEPPTPEAPSPEAPPAEPQPPTPAEAVVFDEFDYDGQRVKIPKSEADALKIIGIRYLQQMNSREQEAQAQQPAQPQAPQQPEGPKDPVKLLEERLAAIEKREKDAEVARARDAERQRIETQFTATRSALESTEVYKKFASKPEAQKMLQLFATGLQYTDGNLSPDEAAKRTVSVLEDVLKGDRQEYVKSKIEAGKNLVEGRGGAAAIPAKPVTKKDLLSGRTEELAEAILTAARS